MSGDKILLIRKACAVSLSVLRFDSASSSGIECTKILCFTMCDYRLARAVEK